MIYQVYVVDSGNPLNVIDDLENGFIQKRFDSKDKAYAFADLMINQGFGVCTCIWNEEDI